MWREKSMTTIFDCIECGKALNRREHPMVMGYDGFYECTKCGACTCNERCVRLHFYEKCLSSVRTHRGTVEQLLVSKL